MPKVTIPVKIVIQYLVDQTVFQKRQCFLKLQFQQPLWVWEKHVKLNFNEP